MSLSDSVVTDGKILCRARRKDCEGPSGTGLDRNPSSLLVDYSYALPEKNVPV